jgi:hypothetical protein
MFPATASHHEPSDVFSNLTAPTTTSRFAYSASRTANSGTPTRDLVRPESVLHARSDNPPIIRTVPAQSGPSRFIPSQTVSGDRGSSIVDTGEHVSYDRDRIWSLMRFLSSRFVSDPSRGSMCSPSRAIPSHALSSM